MRPLIVVLLFLSTAALAQDKIWLYPSTEKVTIDGFDKEPPYIEAFPGKKPNGMTILVVPGGGYAHLAADHEGSQIAKFYNDNGFDCYVLHYRLNDDEQKGHRFPDQYNDVTNAIRIVKSKAKDPDRVGIIGFSAGGHLSSMCATMHVPAKKNSTNPMEKFDSRPAFAMLIYPVITFGDKRHNGSKIHLLGANPSQAMIDSLSTQNRVDKNTPPTFIVYSTDDDVVPVENGIMFYEALKKNGISATIHIFDHGGHGYGLNLKDKVIGKWGEMSVEWINSLKR
ncbi:MAG TPA: alpha/beta hydrolase [Cyclobacteriaceae bacterium]|nr:alpha/beta hydrolase [Cyclobacteriaceae bacterium]